MTQFSYLTSISEKLINGLRRIQSTNLDLSLVPLNDNKQPLGDGWQNRPMKAVELSAAINDGGVEVPIKGETKKIQLQGLGLLTGRPITLDSQTYYLMALDQDGASAANKILSLSDNEPLPPTVAFTSGRPGRCQYLFLVPEEYKNAIRTKKIKTGIQGDDGSSEQLEFRWSNLQSVLPPSVHPTTGEYRWVEGCAIDEIAIAIAPPWVIEQMLIDPTPQTTPLLETLSSIAPPRNGFQKTWTDIDFALSYLNALSSYRADDYDDWLTVGMALHSVNDSLLAEWDSWSQQSSKYKPGECEKKWRSFSENGGVSLGTIGHMAKLDGWCFPKTSKGDRHFHNRTQNRSQENISPSKKTTVNRDSCPNNDTSNPDPLDLSATVSTVTAILKAGLLDYSERDRLDSVQTRSVMSKAAFWQLVAAIRCSLDEVNNEDTARFNQLIDWHNATLDFKKILPHQLSEAFENDALVLNIDPVSLWQYFLPTILSLAGKRVNLDVESHTLPAIAWTCLVSESGTGKSRAENLILAPLKLLQHRENQRWLQDVRSHKLSLKAKSKDDLEPEPPRPERKYLFEVATIQAVMRRLAEQGLNGSLWARDEIAGLFKSLGQFSRSGGESEGLECLLKMWDGSGSFVDRIDAEKDSYAALETRLNIAGGIQPLAFRQAFKDPDDAQGLQARFLYAVPKVHQPKRIKGYCQLSKLLPELYQWFDALPTGTIKLSSDADNRYTNLVEQIGAQAETSSTPTIRAWMRKLPTQLLRIALGLHLVECYFDRDRTFWELQRDTLERAVEVCRYYRSAFSVIQEKAADSECASSILLKIWDLAVTQQNGVTPRDIYRAIKAIGRRAASVGRDVGAYTFELLSKLVQMGKGILEKNGRTIRFFATLNPPNNPTVPDSPQERDINNHSSLSVTEATETQSHIESGSYPSPSSKLSPMTVSNEMDSEIQNQELCQNVELSERVEEITSPYSTEEVFQEIDRSPKGASLRWLLQFLADLEYQPAPHQRFSNNEQLMATFNEAEQKAERCLEQLTQLVPDYFERLSIALVRVSETWLATEPKLEVPPFPQNQQSQIKPDSPQLL
jgi:Protein of unknown function (DUF3987)/Bifunctional DNA primase/polymerase, N-terminal/Primase C terminal 2 (PriCT-2)